MNASPVSVGVRVLGGAAALLVLFLAVGFALPGTWSAERSAVVSAPPEELFALLEAPSAWRGWIDWPSSSVAGDGPDRGPGAALRWDDPEVGQGTFTILEAVPTATVRYRVEVHGGSLRTDGTLTLEAEGEHTRLTWREHGDFGWNPLLGYWARLMERNQGAQLEEALRRLEATLRRANGGPVPHLE